MRTLDLSGDTALRGRNHYVLSIGDRKIAYCFIRKNACSSFKRLFSHSLRRDGSGRDNPRRSGKSIETMETCLAGIEDVRAADYRICVLRPPEARIVSVFRNKFIERKGNRDLFRRYAAATGADPARATFAEFVTLYLTRPMKTLDSHCRSQASHLMPVEYNSATDLDHLHATMQEILGGKLADRFFLNPRNATSDAAMREDDLSDWPADRLAALHVGEGVMPGAGALLRPDLLERIREIYGMDHALLERLNPHPHSRA